MKKINEYDIHLKNIHNFNETRFQMNVIVIAKIINIFKICHCSIHFQLKN